MHPVLGTMMPEICEARHLSDYPFYSSLCPRFNVGDAFISFPILMLTMGFAFALYRLTRRFIHYNTITLVTLVTFWVLPVSLVLFIYTGLDITPPSENSRILYIMTAPVIVHYRNQPCPVYLILDAITDFCIYFWLQVDSLAKLFLPERH